MSILVDLQKQYNEAITRLNNGEKFLGNPNTSQIDKSKWWPTFIRVGEEAESLIRQIEKSGRIMTPEEIREGFKDIK